MIDNMDLWIGLVTICIAACVLLCVYLPLKMRYLHMSQTLQALSESFSAQAKELEDLRKKHGEIFPENQSQLGHSIILAYDNKGTITYANDYALIFFGYQKKELIGQNIDFILKPKTKKEIAQPSLIDKILLNPHLYVDVETQNVRKNGEVVWISWTNRVVYDTNNQPVEIRSVGFDISDRKKLEEKLKHITSTDPLTGVLNRNAFLEAGNREMKRAMRYNRAISLLILKLDCFRALGQEQGYHFGDEALRKTVQACKDSIRESDTLGRIGDVEFALLLPETSLDNVLPLQERLRLKIQEQNLVTEVGKAFITTSFGSSTRQGDKDTMDTLLVRAEQDLKEYHETQKK